MGRETDPGEVEFLAEPSSPSTRCDRTRRWTQGILESAHAWLAQHQRWLDWSEAVLGRPELDLLWARYHHLSKAGETRHVAKAAEARLKEPPIPDSRWPSSPRIASWVS